jgi:hypothetical protein
MRRPVTRRGLARWKFPPGPRWVVTASEGMDGPQNRVSCREGRHVLGELGRALFPSTRANAKLACRSRTPHQAADSRTWNLLPVAWA